MRLLAALLAGFLLSAALLATLSWLLPALLAGLLLTATALLTTLALLAWLIVRVHNCSMSCPPEVINDLTRLKFRSFFLRNLSSRTKLAY